MSTELQNVVESLNYMIKNTYQSYYYLTNFIKYTPSTKLAWYHFPYLDLYNHLVRQSKMNICLNIWKMYVEKKNESITIHKLNRILHDERHINHKTTKTFHKKFKTPIDKIRKQSIAHNDLEKEDYSITLSDMFDILNEIKNNYNEILDKFSMPNYFITEEHLQKMKNECEVSIDMVFSGNIKETIELNL